jgi:hypothetical protein
VSQPIPRQLSQRGMQDRQDEQGLHEKIFSKFRTGE